MNSKNNRGLANCSITDYTSFYFMGLTHSRFEKYYIFDRYYDKI